jgi:hypothetical protein
LKGILQYYDDGTFDTFVTGLDGFVKMWDFDTLDTADPPEDNDVIELDPMMEIEIKNDDNHAALMCVVKISEDPKDTFWYGQVWIKMEESDQIHALPCCLTLDSNQIGCWRDRRAGLAILHTSNREWVMLLNYQHKKNSILRMVSVNG